MTLATPPWLAQRGGACKVASDGKTWFVMLGNQPQYSLVEVPVDGKHGCAIRQTINGRRVASPATYATIEQALAGGLEEVRKTLGWE